MQLLLDVNNSNLKLIEKLTVCANRILNKYFHNSKNKETINSLRDVSNFIKYLRSLIKIIQMIFCLMQCDLNKHTTKWLNTLYSEAGTGRQRAS